ncbi:hypothetical protein P154DRAFT_434520 [Amniculicola lignicola CBS 123094]|uniref:Uncharacterized protein n=1 Tax=Amniculicola lignicola CBS 123094 TaxID=1392246 RepID=A0A6A5WHX6_9PLEO|nr:hypothetical protein P154DRAFT_434520 [Amniculicola lignicola CBS 123094]
MTSSPPRLITRPKTPEQKTSPATPPSTPRRNSRPSSSRSPLNPANVHWAQEQKRRVFMHHLQKWAGNHDSSLHFEGTITPCWSSHPHENIDLGKSVKCTLSGGALNETSRSIVVRLFGPREEDGGRYRMVVRSGAGWTSAREFFDKEYIRQLRVKNSEGFMTRLVDANRVGKPSSPSQDTPSDEKDSVKIRSLFHPFTRLPVELQQMILDCNTVSTTPHSVQIKYSHGTGELAHLPKYFLISKGINSYLTPWIYSTTDFGFKTQGFTNFLWRAGPINRTYIRKVTLSFGFWALLHVTRWLAPDPVFELFDPKLSLRPPAMQYFWRCQIQDLAKELHLSVLTIDILKMDTADLPFVSRVIRGSFASIGRVQYMCGGEMLASDDERLSKVDDGISWGQLCRDVFLRYRNVHMHSQAFSRDRIAAGMEGLEKFMEDRAEFFAGRGEGLRK